MLKIVESALKHDFSEEDLRVIWGTVLGESVVRVRHTKTASALHDGRFH